MASEYSGFEPSFAEIFAIKTGITEECNPVSVAISPKKCREEATKPVSSFNSRNPASSSVSLESIPPRGSSSSQDLVACL